MKLKSLLSALIITTLTLSSFTACGSNNGDTPTTEKTNAATNAGNTETATTGATEELKTDPYQTIANGDITILWHTTEEVYLDALSKNPNHFDAVWSLKPEFEAKYGGTVTVIAVPWGDMKATLISMVSNAEVCDLVESNDQNFPIYPLKNLIQPLDDIMDITDPVFYENVGEVYSFNGKTYAVGSDITATQLYYNKTLFDTYGVKTPDEYYKEGNWNWNTFKEAAMALVDDTDGDGANDLYGYAWWDSMYISFIASNGLPIIDYSGTDVQSNYQKPAAISALQFEQDAFIKDAYIGNMDNMVDSFIGGKLAMTNEHGILAYSDVTFELGVVPFPRGPEVNADYGQGLMTGWSIPITAKNTEGAAAFAYMASKARPEKNREIYLKKWSKEVVDRYENTLQYVQFSPIGIEMFWDANWTIHSNLIEGTPVATFAAQASDQIKEGYRITAEQ